MATTTKTQAPAAPAVTVTLALQPTHRPVPGTLQVKPGLVYNGARAAWYASLLAHNGQPANTWLTATATKPPSLPKSQRPEAPTGWLRWFLKAGACSVVQVPTPKA